MEKNKKSRLNMELSPASKEMLESLVERSSAGSMTEVVREALAIYNVLLKHQQNGGDVLLRNGDQVERLVFV